MSCRAFFAACVIIGLLAPAHAQGTRRKAGARREAPKPKMEPFAAEGSVRAVIPGRIQMLTDSAQNWLIFVDPKATVRVVGTADPNFLRVGMFIRFTTELNNRGSATKKIEQLTLFTPTKQSFPGIWPEGQGPEAAKPAEGEPRFGKGVGGGPAVGKAPTAGVYTIAGRINRVRKGKLLVHAVRAVVEVELAEKAKIAVDIADYSVVKPGDRISVSRGKMFVGRFGLAKAEELTVKLARPLALPKKKPVRSKPSGTKRPDQPPKKAEPPKKPAVEDP